MRFPLSRNHSTLFPRIAQARGKKQNMPCILRTCHYFSRGGGLPRPVSLGILAESGNPPCGPRHAPPAGFRRPRLCRRDRSRPCAGDRANSPGPEPATDASSAAGPATDSGSAEADGAWQSGLRLCPDTPDRLPVPTGKRGGWQASAQASPSD